MRLLAAGAAVVMIGAALLSPVPAAAQDAGPHPDTRSDAYYSEPVAALAADGVFAGTECDEGFCPDEPLDRATMAVWTVRVLDGEDPAPVAATRFDDVDGSHRHAAFIERFAELGVTQGCGDGTAFCPDDTVTRAQMAVFLSRAFSLPEAPDPGFSDLPDGAWYAAEVARLAASRITLGCGDGTVFCPQQDTTRAQMATFLWRAENRPVAASACDSLRRNPRYAYAGAPPERLDIAVYSVAFDDLEAPQFRLDDVLDAAEAQLEALAHGRTDVVFDRRGTVNLPGSAADRSGTTARPFSSGLTALPGELAHLRGDADVLAAFHSRNPEHNYFASFAHGQSAIVLSVRQLSLGDGRLHTDPGNWDTTRLMTEEERTKWLRWKDVARHQHAQSAVVHELLHTLGLQDYYGYSSILVPGPQITSLMRLENYASASRSYLGGPIDHDPVTAWSKWLIGWLDGPDEAQCITVNGPTSVVLRPHQHATVDGVYLSDCHGAYRFIWGPATTRPAFAIVPTSDTTALVIEADALGGDLLDFPRCGAFHPLPPNYAPRRGAVGDIVVYSVDTTVPNGQVPLRVLQPGQSLITEAEYEAYDQYTHAVRTRYEYPEYSADNAYATELVADGYRITVAESTVTDDGLAQVTVIIEPA